jgi:uncharacterized membrane protein (DUF4010 family)
VIARILRHLQGIVNLFMPMPSAMGKMGFFSSTSGRQDVTSVVLFRPILAIVIPVALLVHEIRAAVLLALMSVVIYPLLPDRFVDPWALVNPRQAWVTVIAIASIGFLNYILLRLYSMRGLYYAALLGGLVNSTAAMAELAASFKASERRPTTRAVALILLTTVAMFLRNLVILDLFARMALPTAFPRWLRWRAWRCSSNGGNGIGWKRPCSRRG